MGLNKTRLIAGILGTNSLVSYDSDLTASSYSKGSSGESGKLFAIEILQGAKHLTNYIQSDLKLLVDIR